MLNSNDDAKLPEKLLIELLYRISMSIDSNSWASLHDKSSGHVGFVLIDISASEQELSIEVGNIDLV